MTQITKAMVMAGGYGKRMRPLTNDIPKPMVELQGKPLIDHVFDRMTDVGIQTAVVNVHYLADKLEDYLENRTSPKIIISDERDCLLDTGGGIKKALPHLKDGPFMVHNSDSVWDEQQGSNLQRLIDNWNSEQMDCLMLLASRTNCIGYDGKGDFSMDSNGQLHRRAENETVPFIYAGAYIIHPKLFEQAPDTVFSTNKLWDKAIEEGRLYGISLEGMWMHVGTPEALAEAEEHLSSV